MVQEIRTLQKRLAQAVNESGLSPAVAELVLAGVHTELLGLVEKQAQAEAQPREQKEEADGAL